MAGCAVVALLGGCGVVADGPGATTPDPTTDAPRLGPPPADGAVLLDFDDAVSEPGAAIATATNRGSGTVRVWVSAVNGGRVRIEPGPVGSVVRFPARSTESPAPAAALVVQVRQSEDPLAPGEADFEFGADVALDEGAGDSAAGETTSDNGENVVQRGLWSGPAQYKLQVDRSTASCVLRGSRGEAKVKLAEPLPPDVWFRLRCRLVDGVLSIAAADVHGVEPDQEASAPVAVGTIEFPVTVPLAVGAKVDAEGSVPSSSSDQLNGRVDHVWFRLLD